MLKHTGTKTLETERLLLKRRKFMIMIWNQKEVFVGDSSKRFNEICDILSSNEIEYRHRIVDKNTSSLLGPSRRARTGTFGENMDYSKTYYIYVHKNDYDNAFSLLRKS